MNPKTILLSSLRRSDIELIENLKKAFNITVNIPLHQNKSEVISGYYNLYGVEGWSEDSEAGW